MKTKFLSVFICVYLWLLLPAAFAQQFKPTDMLAVVGFPEGGEPVISPNGEWIAYVASDVALESNIATRRQTGFLWVVRASGGVPRRLPNDRDHAGTPMWSPDGKTLAFISNRHLMLWDAQTGASRTIGGDAAPAEEYPPQWAPDGHSIVIAVQEPVKEPGEKPRTTVVRSADRIVPGDAFFTDTKQWKLSVVDTAGGKSRVITPQALALRGFQVSPDGDRVLYRAVTPETLGQFRAEIIEPWIAALDGKDSPRRALPGRRVSWIIFSPEKREILFSADKALRARSIEGDNERIVISDFPSGVRAPVSAPRSGLLAALAARSGTEPRDQQMYSILRPVEDVIVLDLDDGKIKTLTARDKDEEVSGLTWSSDGKTLFYRSTSQSTYKESIQLWHEGDAKAASVLSGDEVYGALSSSRDGRRLVSSAQNATHPGDAFLLDVETGKRSTITNLNPQLSAFSFAAPEVIDFFSADGEPLRALLFKPKQPAGKVPVVTYTYEKLTPMKNRFILEAQMHVTHGYAYLMPDVLVKVGLTGESFVKCVAPAVNAVRAMGFTNGKFGINGGSFGGYSGLYLISHVDVFAAAALRAPPSEFFSTWGDGRDRDIWTIETGQARAGGSPWQVPESYIANSPFFSADRVHTPVLILHGEKDFTVPTQQGIMMFHALRALKRPAEMVLYREGDHSIVRGSRLDFIDYYGRILSWWEKYLHEH